MKKIGPPFVFDSNHRTYLASLSPTLIGSWNISTKEMKALKSFIKEKLFEIQGYKCAYCQSELNVTSAPQIEHIAPKGGETRFFYPQFTFTEANLVFACSLCNGFTKKGTLDTISTIHTDYASCEFIIVHPYFDNPDEHFNWVNESKEVIIQSQTPKGQKTIDIFKLDSGPLSIQRAKDRDSSILSSLDLPSAFYEIFEQGKIDTVQEFVEYLSSFKK